MRGRSLRKKLSFEAATTERVRDECFIQELTRIGVESPTDGLISRSFERVRIRINDPEVLAAGGGSKDCGLVKSEKWHYNVS